MKKIRFSTVVTALVIAAAAIIFTGCGSSDSTVEQYDYTGFVMGTVLSETIYTTGDDVTEDVEKELSDTEDRLISWRKSDSEIAKINASTGKESVKVSDDTAGYLDSVLNMAKDSGGAFDPTIGKITRLWGFDGETPKLPEESKIKALLKDTGYEKVKLSGSSVRLNADTSLDLGAAGKGLGCDRIKDMFDKDGSVTGAVVTIGGSSIMTYGSKPDGSAWNVAVTDPRDDGDYLGTVAVEGESYISTSGELREIFHERRYQIPSYYRSRNRLSGEKRPHLGDSSMRQRPRQRHAGNGLLCAWKGQRYGAGRKIRCSGSVCRFR